jgi:hypothetical protein
LHVYIDPKDNIKKASHLLKDCRQFLDIQKLCEELRSNSETLAHPMKEGIVASAQSQERSYVPAEVFPVSRGHMNMIHNANVSKRESKKFTREIKLAEVYPNISTGQIKVSCLAGQIIWQLYQGLVTSP